ncbi:MULTISPECIES: hypothetical protein [Dehalococcoides]|jgi:hypothetical protein|uniref:hypothetical protein n=1 Tax=Dehalococcoides TaxID=61434 RepID=UPI0003C83FB2|nr:MULTISPECIES: hypothetical protein [Dehalococcoides]AHB13929.1 hypothetical protein GY50_1158 [Dehalococcoides mccartyi GY50]AII58275.1 hypothetical protein X792_06175 [Dehalococcoides mccartyi CG1]APH12853.1 hypothetical protein ASJ33_06640 [Dehalococcoides mccartyi]QYY57723.1 hypothetical protein CWV2_000976 [Dehalococcoides mccartyi]BAQ35044.1 hypothetical protein UCH007_10860 [Dehalococcoides sp. UCH007]
MKTKSLTMPERELLAGILKNYIGELRVEIIHTETDTYKKALHAREKILFGILRKLEAAVIEDKPELPLANKAS